MYLLTIRSEPCVADVIALIKTEADEGRFKNAAFLFSLEQFNFKRSREGRLGKPNLKQCGWEETFVALLNPLCNVLLLF